MGRIVFDERKALLGFSCSFCCSPDASDGWSALSGIWPIALAFLGKGAKHQFGRKQQVLAISSSYNCIINCKV